MMTNQLPDQSTLGQALLLAEHGFHVFPLVENGRIPAIRAIADRATNDPDQIRQMWQTHDPVNNVTRERNFNIGIYTGRFKDNQYLIAIDVDVKSGKQGKESLYQLDMEYGTPHWLDTWTHKTISGGEHYLFISPTPTRNSAGTKLGPGIDTRGEGGYVVAPGSKIDGKYYTLENDTPPRIAAKWLVDKVGAPLAKEQSNVIEFLDSKPAIEQALSYLSTRHPAIEGENGDAHTLKTAMHIGDLGISQLACLELMHDHWNEHCQPPWDYEALATKVENAYQYRSKGVGINDPENDFDALADEDMPDMVEASKKLPELPEVRADSLHGKEVPVREFLDEKKLIPKIGTTVFFGDGGTGKSMLALQLGAAVATGKQWLGFDVRKGPVYYFSAEDPLDEAHIRLNSIKDTIGTSLKNMHDLHIAPMAGHNCVLAGDNGKGIIKPTKVFQAMQERIQQIGPALVIIDNAIDVFAGDQNSASPVKQVMQLFTSISIQNQCPVLLLAHPSKTGISSGSGDGGSVHWSNSARARLYLSRVQTLDENNRTIENDPNLRVLSNKKANYGPTGFEIDLRWEQGCFARDITDKLNDNSAFFAAERAEDIFMELLDWHAEKGIKVSANKSPSYAPAVFSRHPDAARVSRSQLEFAMNNLLSVNKIETFEYGPPSKRRSEIRNITEK